MLNLQNNSNFVPISFLFVPENRRDAFLSICPLFALLLKLNGTEQRSYLHSVPFYFVLVLGSRVKAIATSNTQPEISTFTAFAVSTLAAFSAAAWAIFSSVVGHLPMR